MRFTPGGAAAARRGLWLLTLSIVTLLCLSLFASSPLRAIGQLLVVDEPIAASDAIVIAVGAAGAGVQEAAELYRRGIAPRVAVFGTPPEDEYPGGSERRLVPKDDADRALRRLLALGVPAERIEPPVSGTRAQGPVLVEWCARKGFRRVVVVTTRDHARRLRRVLNRSIPPGSLTVAVRFSRYSEFDPARWWQSRAGLLIGLEELAKLSADAILHPLGGG